MTRGNSGRRRIAAAPSEHSGKLTLLSGDPGLGKSLLSLAIATAVSRGAPWPVGGGNAPLGSVVMLSAEDAVAKPSAIHNRPLSFPIG